MTSTARSAMRLASSWMVMTSGSCTSRTIFLRPAVPCLLLQAFALAAQRGQRTLALLLVERVGDGEAATDAAFVAGARLDRALFLVAGIGGAGSLFFFFLDDEMLADGLLALALGLGFSRDPLLFRLLPLGGVVLLLDGLLVGDDSVLRPRLLPARAPRASRMRDFLQRPQAGVLLFVGQMRATRRRSAAGGLLGAGTRCLFGRGGRDGFGFGSSGRLGRGGFLHGRSRASCFSTRTDFERP